VQTILIVEDDVDLCEVFCTALGLAGYWVVEAFDGLEALEVLDSDPPHLVVLDLGLPLVSGQHVLEELAAQPHLRDIPVVVVTGSPGPHDGLRVACVLQKPVTPDALVETVRRCMGTPSKEA
jgi:CheY-like chemotaxis protein